ncbi:MAG TPA: hemolysin family protein [Anaerolineales bacterium]|nr:hemolysin family protein [Anaerolineales bacterium]
MTSLGLDLLGLIGIAVLVLANAFFVAAEFALVSVRGTRLAELTAQGNRAAAWAQRAASDPDRFIAATQLGITLASLGLGWLGEPALGHLLEPVLEFFPADVAQRWARPISAGLAFAVITFLHVVVGELAPKSIALQNPERTALLVARPTVWTERLFLPAIWLLNGAGNGLLKLLGIRPAPAHQRVHSVEELKMIVTASAEEGVVEGEEEEMVHAVFDFGDTLVRQVMVPRTEMVAVPAEARLEELIPVAVQHRYTKLPVYEGSLDHVIGVVHLKDLLRALQARAPGTRTARDLMRETIFVPETAHVGILLARFRRRRQHLAVVLDEYGGTAGVVTLEDLVEEIVGKVGSPFDVEPDFQSLPDGTVLVDGLTPIEEINQRFQLDLQDPHYDTLAGFILGRLGRVAQVGDAVTADGASLRVEAMDGLRIARVSFTPPTSNP